MKKILKRLLASAVLVLMLSAFTIPVFASDEDEWFVGTWSDTESESGAAIKLECDGLEPGQVGVHRYMISESSTGNSITEYLCSYTAEYEVGGAYLLIPEVKTDEYYFNPMKILKPDGKADTLEVIVAPGTLSECRITMYRRDPGFLPDHESTGTEQESDDSTISVTEAKDDYDDSHDNSGSLADGSYASDFDDMTTGEVMAASIAAALAAAGIAAGAAAAGKNGKTGTGNGDDGTYTLKDPSTGAESLYLYDDATGEWVSEDGRTVLDISRVKQWETDRAADRKASDKAMEKLRTRDTDLDRHISKTLQEDRDRQKHEDYVNKVGISHGVYSGDEVEVREVHEAQQKSAEKIMESQNAHASHMNTVTVASQVIGKAADVSIDVIATVNPALKPVQALYYGGRNLTANLTDAVVNDKDMMSAVRKGVGETLVEVTQVNVKGLGYKFAAYTVGDAYKKVLKSIDAGKISNEELESAATQGVKDGMLKTVIYKLSSDAGKKLKPSALTESIKDKKIATIAKQAVQGRQNLLKSYTEGAIDKTTYDGALAGLNAKNIADIRLIESEAANALKTAAKWDSVYAGTAKVVQKASNDLATGNHPLMRDEKLEGRK